MSDRKEAIKERVLAELEHLRMAKIEQAGSGVKRLFGPNSLAAQLEAEAETHVSEPVTTEVAELVPNNVVSFAAERAVQMSGLDGIQANIQDAYESAAQEGYQGGLEELSSSIAA